MMAFAMQEIREASLRGEAAAHPHSDTSARFHWKPSLVELSASEVMAGDSGIRGEERGRSCQRESGRLIEELMLGRLDGIERSA
jgi:hypothetical protein